ncbi:hypothetical protein SynA15127_01820 [Synechococcus sp. A15-127]|nr:hypothetical protein SynA15127_01820 [Synechococcus sp. A15-127]
MTHRVVRASLDGSAAAGSVVIIRLIQPASVSRLERPIS